MQIDPKSELEALQKELGAAQQTVLRIQGAIVFLQKKIKEESGSNGIGVGQSLAEAIASGST